MLKKVMKIDRIYNICWRIKKSLDEGIKSIISKHIKND